MVSCGRRFPTHPFAEDEMRFLSTLAGPAGSLAAANARLYRTAEVGRQRLGAILAFHPRSGAVTDQENRLILTNPRLPSVPWRLPGAQGQPTDVSSASRSCANLLKETGERQ